MPVLKNPANRKSTVPLTKEQWHYAFTNTVNDEDSAALYERYEVPAPGRPLFQAATANFNRHAATKVNVHNRNRASLLLVAGGADHVVPKSIVQETRKRYHKSTARTDYKEFAGRPHFTGGVPGWEEVADFCLDWAKQNAEARISSYGARYGFDGFGGLVAGGFGSDGGISGTGAPASKHKSGYGFTVMSPSRCTSKCRCVGPPAAFPVLPTRPMYWPATTVDPRRRPGA